jgi:nuclear pore complex protein Nup155
LWHCIERCIFLFTRQVAKAFLFLNAFFIIIKKYFASTELSLSQRVEYLSRAILCVKSGESGVGGRAAGELLHHLEEKMEVLLALLPVLEVLLVGGRWQSSRGAATSCRGENGSITSIITGIRSVISRG